MNKTEVLNYIMHTPYNTNRAVLSGILDDFANAGDLDTSDATATAKDIVENKTAYVDGNKVVGSRTKAPVESVMSDMQNTKYFGIDFSDSRQNITVSALRDCALDRNSYFVISNSSLVGATGTASDKIKAGDSILGVEGSFSADATAVAGDIADGKTAYVKGNKVVGTLVSLDTSDATASDYDILDGQTAYVNGEKITGTMPIIETEALSYVAQGSQKMLTGTNWAVSAGSEEDADNNIYVQMIKSGGYIGRHGSITFTKADLAKFIGLSSDSLKPGVKILGITGI